MQNSLGQSLNPPFKHALLEDTQQSMGIGTFLRNDGYIEKDAAVKQYDSSLLRPPADMDKMNNW